MLWQALQYFWFFPSSLLAYFWQYFCSGNIRDITTWQAAGSLCGRKTEGGFVLGGWEKFSVHSPGALEHQVKQRFLLPFVQWVCLATLSNFSLFLMIYIVQACDYGRQPLCVGFTILQKVSPVIKAVSWDWASLCCTTHLDLYSFGFLISLFPCTVKGGDSNIVAQLTDVSQGLISDCVWSATQVINNVISTRSCLCLNREWLHNYVFSACIL